MAIDQVEKVLYVADSVSSVTLYCVARNVGLITYKQFNEYYFLL